MHLGSTMCESSGPTAPPVSQCARPNRPIIRFSEFDPDDDVIVLDLQALFASSDLTQDTANSSAGCQSFPEDVNECTGAFNRLGLDFNTGACVGDCGSQTAFRVESAVARGQTAFTTSRLTTLGEMLSCSSCHGADGSGGIGPDIRASTAEHVREHPFGNGPHPIKFTSLTRVEANDIAAYLASICRADPACEPGSVEHEHP
jgi:cytochrome c553